LRNFTYGCAAGDGVARSGARAEYEQVSAAFGGRRQDIVYRIASPHELPWQAPVVTRRADKSAAARTYVPPFPQTSTMHFYQADLAGSQGCALILCREAAYSDFRELLTPPST